MKYTVIRKIIVVVVAILVLFSSCGVNSKSKNKYGQIYVDLFDTVIEIIVYADTKERFEEYKAFFYTEMKEYHKMFDIYNEYYHLNNIKTINDNAGIQPVKVDEDIRKLIKYSKEQYTKTGGKVNIAFGPVLEVWHNYRTNGIDDTINAKLPTTKELEKANKLSNIDDVILDEQKRTIYLAKDGMRLDVGAIAKGYAAQEIAKRCSIRFPDITSSIINVGGNIVATGKKEGGAEWKLAIRDPKNEKKTIKTLSVSDKSVVTSGDYERVYTVAGKQYHHIINPDTLMPSQYFSSVSVICDSKNSADADVLSTALFNISLEDGKELLKQYENTTALWITKDNVVIE